MRHLAEGAFLDQLCRFLERFALPLLDAHRHDAIVLARGLDGFPARFDLVRQRFLDVDVLAGGARLDRDRAVPVVGRGDENGVDVLALEQPLVVLVALDLDAGLQLGQVGDRVVEPHLVRLGDGDELAVGMTQEEAGDLVAAVAAADEAHADAAVRLPAPGSCWRRSLPGVAVARGVPASRVAPTVVLMNFLRSKRNPYGALLPAVSIGA